MAEVRVVQDPQKEAIVRELAAWLEQHCETPQQAMDVLGSAMASLLVSAATNPAEAVAQFGAYSEAIHELWRRKIARMAADA